MKRRGTVFVSLFVIFFAFAALAAGPEDKPDEKPTGTEEKKSAADHGKKGPDAKRSESPVTDTAQADKEREAREKFLANWFPLTKEQPAIFQKMIVTSPTEAGTGLGQLMGSIGDKEIEKLLEKVNEKLKGEIKDDDKKFFERIKWGALLESGKKIAETDEAKEFEKAFKESQDKKKLQTKCWDENTELLKKDPASREKAQAALKECGFQPDHYLAYVNHYTDKTKPGQGADSNKAAMALDVAGTADKEGRVFVNVQDPTDEKKMHSIALGTTETKWDARKELLNTAVGQIESTYAKTKGLQPAKPNSEAVYILPTKAAKDGDKATMAVTSLKDLDAKYPLPTVKKEEEKKEDTKTELTKADAPKFKEVALKTMDSCQKCHSGSTGDTDGAKTVAAAISGDDAAMKKVAAKLADGSMPPKAAKPNFKAEDLSSLTNWIAAKTSAK